MGGDARIQTNSVTHDLSGGNHNRFLFHAVLQQYVGIEDVREMSNIRQIFIEGLDLTALRGLWVRQGVPTHAREPAFLL